jgi:Concanavalin A-like lectin/glucanases superfamily
VYSVAKISLTTLVVIGFATVPASAATVQGQWSMDLAAGSSVIHDTAGNADIDLQGDYSDASGAVGGAISFDFADGASLGSAESQDQFNPGTAPFAVAAYLKTPTVPSWGDFSPNIVQKGFYSSNGQWKMQLKPTSDGTIADCRFAGTQLPDGDIVVDHTKTALDDGSWHEIVCWREDGQYGISVDGNDTTQNGEIGDITTSRPLRIANKSGYAGVEDQFQGKLDCVAYVEGSNALASAESHVPC